MANASSRGDGATTGGQSTILDGGAATGSSATVGCPGSGGPSMVMLPEGYCIDSTEVRRDQYTAWLNSTTAATISGQDVTNCGWNTTFTPDATCMGSNQVCQGTGCENHPQVCVDWCDAYAYCADVGKRLCGKIGGGTNLYADYANASMSQWYNACSSGGVNGYPFGSRIDEQTLCNGADYNRYGGGHGTVAVGSLNGCQATGPYAGVFDLSGNVWEWEDSCAGIGQSAECRQRGGTFTYCDGTTYDSCATDDNLDDCAFDAGRNLVSGQIGFRCCSS